MPEFDFIVIGSGFGGSVSALRLAEKGYRVAVLEAGKRFRDHDFATCSWQVRKFLWAPRLRCFGILRITNLPHVMVLSGAGVGGGSLGYANTHLAPPPVFFQSGSWPAGTDWARRLAPHYATARRMLGVTRVPDPTPADVEIFRLARAMGCRETFRLQDVAVFFGEPGKTVPDPYFQGRGPSRRGCTHCGGCMVGCRHNAKNTLDKNYLYLAERLAVKIFPETKARLLRPVSGGYVVETTCTTSLGGYPRKTFKAAKVILAAGVLGTLELLFQCRDRGTLPNLSPMLGRRVRTNSESLTGVSARKPSADFSKGVAITSSIYPDPVTHIEPVRYPKGSDLMSLLTTILPPGGCLPNRRLAWLRRAFARPLDLLRVHWPFGWAQKTIILLVMQTIDNSIALDHQRHRLLPRVKRFVSRPEKDSVMAPDCIPQAQEATEILAQIINGLPQNAIGEIFLKKGTTAHILGGCVMGDDPSRGVIDRYNRVFGHPGLYVVDGSMVPANPGVNPSLTITAMAEHAMSHIGPVKD